MKNSRAKLLWWNRLINAVLLIVLLLTGYNIFFPEADSPGQDLVQQVQLYAQKGLDRKALAQANTLDFTNLYPIAFGQANLLVLWPPGDDAIKELARELEVLTVSTAADFKPEFAVRIGYSEEKGDAKILTGFYYNRNGLVQSGERLYRLSAAGQQVLNRLLANWVALTEVRNGFYLAACRRDWAKLEQLATPAVIKAVQQGKIVAGEPVQVNRGLLEIESGGTGQLKQVRVKDRVKLKSGREFNCQLTIKLVDGRWQIIGLN